ncbi:MAG: hypothetical protein HC919_06205 [Oscillatoriales cyanobacterium SM2_2_1]|nr:hypothetical protein [Oscillatoriales cyanobacterium SM2_2_1]
MKTQLQELLDRAQERYLTSQDLKQFEDYVASLPDRLALYRLLRDQEVALLQRVADQAEAELKDAVGVETLEEGIKNLILVLRYGAMAMLLDDEGFLKQRLLSWLERVLPIQQMRQLNEMLYRFLNQELKQRLTPRQQTLLLPLITTAQVTLIY